MDTLLIILLIAVAGPILGSLIGIIKRPSRQWMYSLIAFAAGVMLGISFLQLIPRAITQAGVWLAIAGVFAGGLLMYAVDRLIPHIHPALETRLGNKVIRRVAAFILVGMFFHNIPEGFAIAAGSVAGADISLAIAFAIAIHHIPEGICTSAPYYYATKKRLRSFLLSSSTAIPLVIGFLLGKYLFPGMSAPSLGFVVAATAGFMLYISADELIPTSCNNARAGWSHITIFSFFTGVAVVMALSLI